MCIRCVESPQRKLERCSARMDYGYPWTHIIARFKFQGQPAWAATLASFMLDNAETMPWLHEADLLAPIPLSPSRLRERGFNQAWELLRQLKQQAAVNAPAVPDLLLRAETDRLQHKLAREERFSHARTALQVNARHTHLVHAANVLLVDDIMTTGATLEAAAHTLLAAGAASVSAMVFARTPAPLDPGSETGDGME